MCMQDPSGHVVGGRGAPAAGCIFIILPHHLRYTYFCPDYKTGNVPLDDLTSAVTL